jgi:hypothetical protein
VPLFQETSIYGDSNTIISRMNEESYGQQKYKLVDCAGGLASNIWIPSGKLT